MSFNLDKLTELTGGNEARIKLYLETYLEGTNEQLPLLRSAIESSDLHQIRTVMHTLKPLFTIIGFNDLWEKANEIETKVDLNQQLEGIPDLSKMVEQMIQDSIESINSYNQA